ncbi:hypothetical protein N6H18_11805 [Reichenbachiella agarivorans]|uniref:Uncharacterized protein n=1 Tax=Reichenbachiella agarivorans TaxID=2979464 RepID=A0ABY6CMQ2_9BACT|nr:hypothetical protein [Reichenbachiella agarivorans]UXP31034.1 hypothetical protein N6H18_11805 [Reichenbachiella agarivorans]
MLRIFLLTWLMIGIPLWVFSQAISDSDSSILMQTKRVEYEVSNEDIRFELVQGDDEGILMIRETRRRTSSGFIWTLNYLDTSLNENWTVDINVLFGMSFMGHDFNGESFFLLFAKDEYKLEELYVIKVDKADGALSDYHVNTVLPMTLSHFEVLNHSLIFGGSSNNRPVVLFYQLEEKKAKVLPGIYNNKSEIVDILVNDERGVFTVVLNERSHSKDFIVSLKIFSGEGKTLHTSALKTIYEKSLIDGVPTDFDFGIQYVAGAYSNRNSDVSRGLYLAKLVNGEQEFIKYHSYGDLDNFFSYLGDNREVKMKRKINKRRESGKNLKFNYRLLVHDIVKRGEEYILIGEAYYPKYSSNTSVQGSMINPYDQLNQQQAVYAQPKLLGYNYTHAVVVGFSADGEILWDNSFEINDVLVFPLIENVQVSVNHDKIILMYAHDNMLKTKIIQGDSVLEGKTIENIELSYEGDQVKESIPGMEGIKWWYDKSFYAYGMQKIKNMTQEGVKMNRKVFYINKVEF